MAQQAAPIKIALCNCANAYQDKKYGKNKRAFNLCGGGSHAVSTTYRCSVCGTEK
jgi:hypothetical protein